MNLPNRLTILRILLVPVFILFLVNLTMIPGHYLIAGVIFAIASFTDFLDGKIARKRNLVTNFGKFLDPLADKILVLAALVCFSYLGLTEVWFVLIILARDFMVTSVRMVAAYSGEVVAANIWGKAKTVSQMVAITVILLMQFFQELITLKAMPGFSIGSFGSDTVFVFCGNVLIGICTVFTILSGVVYLVQNWKLFKSSK